jgi:hypothetical protein
MSFVIITSLCHTLSGVENTRITPGIVVLRGRENSSMFNSQFSSEGADVPSDENWELSIDEFPAPFAENQCCICDRAQMIAPCSGG